MAKVGFSASQIRELQETLQASQMQAGKNEDDLRQEITVCAKSDRTYIGTNISCNLKELRKRLQGLESSKDDVFSKIEEATAPLLRQIEELQTQHSIAMKTRDQKEQKYAWLYTNFWQANRPLWINSIIFRLKTAEIERDEAKKKAYDTSSELTSAVSSIWYYSIVTNTNFIVSLNVLKKQMQHCQEKSEKLCSYVHT